MKKTKEIKQKTERGITLISLVITIVIMVILAALVVKTIAGDNNLIGMTTEGAENYKIAEYKELLSAEVTATIQGNMIKGEGTTLGSIADGIEQNVQGITGASVNQDSSITNEDILVTTQEGYVFQIYYSDETGNFYIEYIGKGDINEFPKVVARYNRASTQIEIEANTSQGSIEETQLYFKGGTLQGDSGSTNESFRKTITESGLYTVKVTTSTNKIRYAWVKVTSLKGDLEMPSIEETNGIHGGEGWYKSGLEVTISSSDERVTEIHYQITNSENVSSGNTGSTGTGEDNYQIAVGNRVVIPISTLGRTNITAYVTDGKNKSETNTRTVKFDNVSPTISLSDVGTGWHKNNVSINVSGTDTNSGINGYTYYLNGSTKGTDVSNISTPITISTEGTTTVKVQTKDKAGNVSGQQERTVKLDKTGPVFNSAEIEKTNITATSFTVTGVATDNLSGIEKYICYVSENGSEILQKENTTGTFEITERRANTRYDIRITAVDNAGNESEVPCTGYVRTVGELKAPNLSVIPQTTGATMTSGYYKCGVKITVTDTASPSTTTAASMHYEVVDANNESLQKASGEVTNYANFSQEGNFKVRAWAEDEDGNKSTKTEWQNFGIDTAPPTIPSINLVGTAGTNDWFKSNITVTITAGNDVTSGVRGVQYYTEKGSTGGQAITGDIEGKYLEIPVTDGETTSGAGSTSITITLDRNNKNTCKNSR